jgi:uncharacterized protein YceK
VKKLAIVVLLCATLAMGGCSLVNVNINGQSVDTSSAGAAVQGAKDAAGSAACAAIRTKIDQQFTVARSDTLNADISVSFGSLVKSLNVNCPSGGTYTWDSQARSTSCSAHAE